MLFIRFCHIVMRMMISFGGGIRTCQSACFTNNDLISFPDIDVILSALLLPCHLSKLDRLDSILDIVSLRLSSFF